MNFLTLKEYKDSRIFVIGSLEGDYYRLIDFLFDQFFCYKDLLILTGNFINPQEENSNKIIEFLSQNANCFSVKGYNEKIYVDGIRQNKYEATNSKINYNHFEFIESLPLVIEVQELVYVVHSGFNLKLSPQKQTPEYTIFKTNSLQESDWYNSECKPVSFCFSNELLQDSEVCAGYNLGSVRSKLSSLIFSQDSDPILVEV